MADNNENKVLNVPHLRFPEFSGEWKMATFGDIAKGFDYGMNAAAKSFDGNNKYIRITDIDEVSSQYLYDDVVSPDGELEDRYLVKENDILLARTGASTGKSYLYRNSDGKLYFAGFLIRANIYKHNSYFVFSQLHTLRYKKWISVMSARSGQPGINSQEYASFPVYTTSLQEEDKIATFLKLLDERIITQNKIIEKLQSLIKGLVDELMTVLLKGKLYPFSSFYIKAGEGGTPTTSVVEYYTEGTIPFIKIEDLSCKYLTNNKDFITELGMQKSSAWLIPSKSVIYSNGATIGAISINEYPVCTKQGILGIVPNTNINVEYLYLLMSSSYFSKEISRIITEGTMKTAYLKDINHIKCPLPSMAQQKNITNLTSSIEEKLSIEQELLRFLNLQKQYLLHMMFI